MSQYDPNKIYLRNFNQIAPLDPTQQEKNIYPYGIDQTSFSPGVNYNTLQQNNIQQPSYTANSVTFQQINVANSYMGNLDIIPGIMADINNQLQFLNRAYQYHDKAIGNILYELQRQKQEVSEVSYKMPDYIVEDPTQRELLVVQKNSKVVSNFANGTIHFLTIIEFDDAYCLERRYRFLAKPFNKQPKEVDILFSEMTPKKIIEKFSTYGGMAFLGKMSDTQKGELLRAFLIPKTDCIKVTFVHYFSGWRIDEDKKSMTYYMMSKELRNNIKKGYPLENYHFPSFLAKTWQKSIVPLIMFKNVFSSLLPTAVLITWVHYGLLYSVLESKGFLISMPLYIIGQEYGIMKLVQSIMRGLHCKEDNCIALLEEKRKFEQDLFCARDEVIIINNTISATTKTQQQKQEERLLLLNRFISGDQKISGPNKAISKKIEAAIVILGRTLPEEKNILSLEIESTMLNQKALQKWFLNADSITDYFCHFIDMYKCGWEVYDKALNTALEANICEGQSLFEEMDYVQAYAVLASMADLLSIYVRREQLEISPSDFIGKMKDEIVNFLQYNKEMDLAGLSMLLKSILKKIFPFHPAIN